MGWQVKSWFEYVDDTLYFTKLSQQNGTDRWNPGIRAFFNKNKELLNDDVVFTDDLKKILNTYLLTSETSIGRVVSQL